MPNALSIEPALRERTIALVGLMGAGKSSIGRRLAHALDLPFKDADEEVERAAARSISEIFEDLGEAAFRDGERRVIARLLDDPPHVLATSGGAFMNADTRALIGQKAISVWLRADMEVLLRRVARRNDRPLLNNDDPRAVLEALAQVRNPVYALADIAVDSVETAHQATVQAILDALRAAAAGGAGMSRNVTVGLGARAYEVVIGPGLIDTAGGRIAPLLKNGRTAVVADETVAALHGERLMASLAAAGLKASLITIAPGEASKSFAGLESLLSRLLELNLEDRGDLVTAFGGGVVGDLAGFAGKAIYKRGIDFVQIPTTLLAQVDSSVGGKTAIDTPHGKNLVGAFHQPRLVLADLDVLDTLPEREMRCGYAEVIKYGMLGDAAFFAWLEANGAAVLAREPDALAQAIGRSVQMKAEIVEEDEREQGRRALLNLGHTFGHALETEVGFGDLLLHGEAVALGCARAFRFSATQGFCSPADARRVEAALSAAGLPVRLAQISNSRFKAEALIAHMAQDKKAEGGRLTLILARRVGEAFVAKDVDPAALRDFLIEEGAAP